MLQTLLGQLLTCSCKYIIKLWQKWFCEVVAIRDTRDNQMVSFNWNTVRHREKMVRGLKKEDSAILTRLRLYHNHVRPHHDLLDNMTPGEAAGIRIKGVNK